MLPQLGYFCTPFRLGLEKNSRQWAEEQGLGARCLGAGEERKAVQSAPQRHLCERNHVQWAGDEAPTTPIPPPKSNRPIKGQSVAGRS